MRVVNTNRMELLVVDDEPSIRDLMSRWLTDAGYHCTSACNASEALAYLRDHEVDLVTLDIRMPGCSGLELLKQIKLLYPEIAVVMMTGEGNTSAAIEALTSGAYGYLQKPTGRMELIIEARKALEHRQMVIEKRLYTEGLAAKVREQTAAIVAAHEETIHRLIRASLYRDEETGAHIQRTGEYSELLALKAGWSIENAKLIRLAAPLHDIGKIGIRDVILQKPGKLTDDEMRIMQTHTVIGAQMLDDSKLPMIQMAREIALYHHERWDGTGYPNALFGLAIPESARIVAIVDVYDALSHDRVYRPAFPKEKVISMLQEGRGKHFDPVLLDLFFEILPTIRATESTTCYEEIVATIPSSRPIRPSSDSNTRISGGLTRVDLCPPTPQFS